MVETSLLEEFVELPELEDVFTVGRVEDIFYWAFLRERSREQK